MHSIEKEDIQNFFEEDIKKALSEHIEINNKMLSAYKKNLKKGENIEEYVESTLAYSLNNSKGKSMPDKSIAMRIDNWMKIGTNDKGQNKYVVRDYKTTLSEMSYQGQLRAFIQQLMANAAIRAFDPTAEIINILESYAIGQDGKTEVLTPKSMGINFGAVEKHFFKKL